MTKLVLCLCFFNSRMQSQSCQVGIFSGFLDTIIIAHTAKVGTLSGVLEDEEFILSKLVSFLGFWIRRCREHLDKVGTCHGFWIYEEAELILPKLVLCVGFWI